MERMGSLVQTKTIAKLCNPMLHFSDWKSMPKTHLKSPPCLHVKFHILRDKFSYRPKSRRHTICAIHTICAKNPDGSVFLLAFQGEIGEQ